VLYSAWRTKGGNEDSRIQTPIDFVVESKVPWGLDFDTVGIVVERIVRYDIVGAEEYPDATLLAVAAIAVSTC